MKKLLLLLLALTPLTVFAEDTVKQLDIGDTIYGVCVGGEICPEVPEISQFSKKHGYQHPWRADDLKEDCTMCHSMYGDDGIVASRNISCASVDEFVPPGEMIFDTSDAGVEFDTTGTKVGYLPKGTPIKCGSCHEGVEVYVNGEEEEFDFEDWRDDRLSQLGIKDEDEEDDDDDNQNPTPDPDPIPDPDPTPDPAPYQCGSKEMNEKHDFTPTPSTNCAACHGDGRTCD